MKIVIELDDNVYGLLKRTERVFKYIDKEDDTVDTALMRAVINGTPLPKHHGRLIEVNALLEHELFTFTRYTGIDDAPCEDASIIIDNAPTIIEGSESE